MAACRASIGRQRGEAGAQGAFVHLAQLLSSLGQCGGESGAEGVARQESCRGRKGADQDEGRGQGAALLGGQGGGVEIVEMPAPDLVSVFEERSVAKHYGIAGELRRDGRPAGGMHGEGGARARDDRRRGDRCIGDHHRRVGGSAAHGAAVAAEEHRLEARCHGTARQHLGGELDPLSADAREQNLAFHA